MWADDHRITSPSKTHLERMLKDLIDEGRWDLEPKPANPWWRSTYVHEAMEDIESSTRTGQHRVPFKIYRKILVYTLNQARKTQDGLENMQNANKAWWRDVKIYRSKDVPWKRKMQKIGSTTVRNKKEQIRSRKATERVNKRENFPHKWLQQSAQPGCLQSCLCNHIPASDHTLVTL